MIRRHVEEFIKRMYYGDTYAIKMMDIDKLMYDVMDKITMDIVERNGWGEPNPYSTDPFYVTKEQILTAIADTICSVYKIKT